jgi:hypothetical protein
LNELYYDNPSFVALRKDGDSIQSPGRLDNATKFSADELNCTSSVDSTSNKDDSPPSQDEQDFKPHLATKKLNFMRSGTILEKLKTKRGKNSSKSSMNDGVEPNSPSKTNTFSAIV